MPLLDSTKDKGLLSNLWRRKGTGRISERDVGLQINEYISIQCPQLITTAHKYDDSIQRKHQRVSKNNKHDIMLLFVRLLASRLSAEIHSIRVGLHRTRADQREGTVGTRDCLSSGSMDAGFHGG